MLDGLVVGKKEADQQWCAQEMEWVRPYMKGMVKASYGVYVPAGSLEEVKDTNGTEAPSEAPGAKRPRIAGGPEAELTCMLGCMADMLRDTQTEKRWELFDKFREFAMELSSNGET
ncbi:hypothetical protein AAVH_33968 [Aphelenchoides avenae]|nr:hypothetical protein AAVH_33968 [Aphelenchus avenae]